MVLPLAVAFVLLCFFSLLCLFSGQPHSDRHFSFSFLLRCIWQRKAKSLVLEAEPGRTMLTARPTAEMRGHTGFLTFASLPPFVDELPAPTSLSSTASAAGPTGTQDMASSASRQDEPSA
eukprot:m.442134 g.442134  ORF g.442134 m.442134 type:complete len:120 (+) comp56812_c0_seq14:25-384(+)